VGEESISVSTLPGRVNSSCDNEINRRGLYYYGARYYEPATSRWMSPDPAGFELINPMDEDGEPRAGYSVIEALNWYAYVSNNSVKYVDPTGEDDQYYAPDGTYLRTVESETENTYVEQQILYKNGGAEVTQTLVGTTEDVDAMAATVFAESSGDKSESYGIASVIDNRVESTGKSIKDVLANTGIYGYGSPSYDSVHGKRGNDNSKLKTAYAATINALTGGDDHSGGAHFWEGLTFIEPSSSNYNPNNWFVQKGWGNTAGTGGGINYLETTRHGGTVFLKNNPALHGSRRYP